MQSRTPDRYPSRTGGEPQLLERAEPVVHGTESDGPLTSKQLEEFDERGLLHLDEVFSGGEVQDMLDDLQRMIEEPGVRERENVVVEPTRDEVRSIFDVPQYSALVGDLLGDERVAGAARQILGSDVYLHQTRVNSKPGLVGTGFNWHSDFETWHTEDGMPTPRCLSASILLTDNHTQNGPLLLMPGSQRTFVTCVGETPEHNHRSSLTTQVIGIPDEKLLGVLYERHGIHVATGTAGSMILFDSNTIHGSNGNITPDPRANVFAVFNSVENTLVEPFAAPAPRPEYLGSRDSTPLPPARPAPAATSGPTR